MSFQLYHLLFMVGWLLAVAAAAVGLYWVIRLAVRAGIKDAREHDGRTSQRVPRSEDR